MIKTIEDRIFNACKTGVGFCRSKKFKDWFHKEYPGMQMHHLFGSYTAIKTSDYCSVPVTAQEHEYAEKHKSEFAIDRLPLLFQVITKYILYLEEKLKNV